jgi:hypothetical protein
MTSSIAVPTKVELGMTPTQAIAAGGSCAVSLSPDPAVWPSLADPDAVLTAQAEHPDDSEITLVFENDRQFPGQLARFRALFRSGRVDTIERL